jgi:protein phosphatase
MIDEKVQIKSFGLSDIGSKRLMNEDVFAELKEHHFFVLADGMGGHRAGEVAAKEAVFYLCDAIKELLSQLQKSADLDTLIKKILKVFENANHWIYHLSHTNENLHGMGTTLCSLLFHNDHIVYSHVGDSRIYRLRNNKLELITKDHSVLMRSKTQQTKLRKMLTQVIGTPKQIYPQVGSCKLEKGDLYLLCSDGLSDFVAFSDIELILKRSYSLKEKTKILIRIAKNLGSLDNITVLLVEVGNHNAT